MRALWQDLRYAVRMLAKEPGFTLVAVLTLALGIGANTAMFSVINSALLRPLPFKDPGQLVQLWETEGAPGQYPLTGPDYLEWQRGNRTFDATSVYSYGQPMNARIQGEAEPASTIATQANFFTTLGVSPELGRVFAAGEDQDGKNHVAVLSAGFWQEHFGGRRDAVGATIGLDGQPYTVIGVMPAWFNSPARAEIWTPIDATPKGLGGRGTHHLRAIGRIKANVGVGQARADLSTIAARLAKEFPDNNKDVNPILIPLKEQLTGESRTQLLILFGAVGLVLLVACANVANLMLARATARQREMAVRTALGAGRARLIRQLLTESLLLSVGGAALGVVGAWWCVAFMQSLKTLPIPRANPIELNFGVLLFTAGVSILVGVLFGLAPALQASQLDVTEELKTSAQAVVGATAGRRGLRNSLVVGELAASLALLIGAGLLLRTFARMRTADIGVESANVLTAGMILPDSKYPDLPARRAFVDRLTDRLQRLPGVKSVSLTAQLPLEGGSNGYIEIPGETNPALANQLVDWSFVTPDYFSTFRIPLLAGRNFTPAEVERAAEISGKLMAEAAKNPDLQKAPPDFTGVAVISRSMAQTFWPHQDAVGKVFKNFMPITVIGVVGDVKVSGVRDKPMPTAYFPFFFSLGFPGFSARIVLKTQTPPSTLIGPARAEVSALDSGLALFGVRTMDQVIAESMQETSVQTLLLGVFAGLALVLAAVGIYGVMAYLVTQRTHEIGVRMALGAQQSNILSLVLGQGSRLAALGIAIGIGAALGLSRLMSSLLFGVSATDPLTYAGVASLLAVVALAACYMPARRAVRVDPMIALRYE